MIVEVCDTATAQRRAAESLGGAVRAAISARGTCSVAFSRVANTDVLLSVLADSDLPWEHVHVFQVDERVAPDDDLARNMSALRRGLLDHVEIPEKNVHSMPVNLVDLGAAADDYAAILREVCGTLPVLDVIHLGLGVDGHTASLLPADPVLGVTDRDAAPTGVHDARRRLTLTYPVLNRARRIVWIVTGGNKAAALGRLVAGDTDIPAGRVERSRAVAFSDVAPDEPRQPDIEAHLE